MATSKAPTGRAAGVDAAAGGTGSSIEEFLAAVPDAGRRADAQRLSALMAEVTGEPPALWAGGIVGFGTYHYRYDSGHEGDAPLAAFAPRKPHLVVYLCAGFEGQLADALARLGPHKAGKGCLYVKHLADVDETALRDLIAGAIRVHRAAS